MGEREKKVLVIDDDRDIADIVHAILTDAGFTVSVLAQVQSDAIRVAVGQQEPDCVVLDGQGVAGYGTSSLDAEWMHARGRRVPVVMFTVEGQALHEAREATSERSQAAAFAAILSKPFDVDELLDSVAQAVGQAIPFDLSSQAESRRTNQLREKLEAAGAREIHTSTRREWANFRTEDGTLVQMYWWQRDGVYYVMRHAESGGRIDQLAGFTIWTPRSHSVCVHGPERRSKQGLHSGPEPSWHHETRS
jgi:DNA-binding NtrC family response regulator